MAKPRSFLEEFEQNFITIQDLNPESRILLFFDTITAVTAAALCDKLISLDMESHDPVLLVIGGPGGDMGDMIAIVQTMKMIESPVHTLALGHIASGCSSMFMAGEAGHRYIHKSSSMMLHNPQLGMDSSSAPNVKQFLRWVDMQEVKLLELTLPKGMTIEAYRRELQEASDCLVLDAEQSVKTGFADQVVEKFDFNQYHTRSAIERAAEALAKEQKAKPVKKTTTKKVVRK